MFTIIVAYAQGLASLPALYIEKGEVVYGYKATAATPPRHSYCSVQNLYPPLSCLGFFLYIGGVKGDAMQRRAVSRPLNLST